MNYAGEHKEASVRLTLFSRLAIGYLAIFLIVAVASAYAIVQLHFFRELTESILNVDNRILDHEKSSPICCWRKAAPSRNLPSRRTKPGSCNLSVEDRLRGTTWSRGGSEKSRATPILKKIQQDYSPYHEFVNGEAHLARAAKPYPQAKFKQDKDGLVDGMLDAFEKLRLNQQQATNAKVMDLAAAADQAREVSVTIAIACLLAIVLMSLLITKSITRPIDLLKNKTREIAEGNLMEHCT